MTKPAKSINQHRDYSEKVSLAGGMMIRREHAAIAALLFITFLIFAVALKNEMLIGWDDGEYFTNPSVTGNSQNGQSVFSTFYLGMYQPLAILTFKICYNIWGDLAWLHILTNILIHLLNTFLVFKLMQRWSLKFEASLVVAFLFALHPMHVEGVVWISTRSSLLYSLFFLTGLLQYHKYLNGFKVKDLALTGLWFLLSLLSKSMAATFPLILLLIDYFTRRPINKKAIIEKIPFLVFSVIFGIISIKASESFGHITVLEQDYSFLNRIFLILYGISFYLIKLILPLNLSAIYSFPEITSNGLPAWVYGSMIALVIAVLIIWYAIENRRIFIFGFLFFVVHIGMVLPLFWSRIFITADRYTYLPYIGLFIIVAVLITNLIEKRQSISSSSWNMVKFILILGALAMCVTTFSRTKVWHDIPTLLGNVIENKRSDADLAHAYFYLGNYNDLQSRDKDAMKYYDLALARNPKHLLALNNRGILKGKLMNIPGAVSDFSQAITLKPDYAEAYYNRGVAYYQGGQQQQACSDWTKASQLRFSPANSAISQYCRDNIQPDFNIAFPNAR